MTFDDCQNEQLINAQLLGELFLCKFVIRQDDFDGSPHICDVLWR